MADRLYRSRDERMIGGVAGGMAENLGLDPTVVRIAWVLLALVAPITPLVYFVLMFVIPEEPRAPAGSSVSPLEARQTARPGRRGGDRSAGLIFGVLLVLVGAWFLIRPYIPRLDVGAYWPYIVIGLGVVLIVAAAGRGGRSAD